MTTQLRIFLILISYGIILLAVLFSSGRDTGHEMGFEIDEMTSVSAIRGKRIWEQNGCYVCHSVFGLGGHLGPDLTNVMRKRDAVYVRQVIGSGINKMPTYAFSESEMQSLVAYLQYLNQLGTYPLHSPMKEFFGNYGS